jgi:hypothetical protein
MLTLLVLFLAFAQAAPADTFNSELFKKEIRPLQDAVATAVTPSVARIMQDPKATYLEGFGIVITMEVILEAPGNPFTRVKTDQELRASVAQRRKDIKDKVSELLKQRVVKMESIRSNQSIAVVVHLLNGTPVETPDLPTQLVVSVQKDTPGQIKVREY